MLDRLVGTAAQEGQLLLRGRSTLVLPALVLAATVGAALALGRVVDSAFWQPLPFPESHRLVALTPFQISSGQRFGRVPIELFDATAAGDLLDTMASVSSDRAVWLNEQAAESLDVALLSRQAPAVFGLRPIAGRLLVDADFTAAGDDAAGPVPAMLSEAFWDTRFGRDPSVVGRVLTCERRHLLVVGVAARVPYLPSVFGTLDPQVFAADQEAESADFVLVPFARLTPGVSIDTAAAQVAARLDAVRDAHPRLADLGLDVRSLRDYVYGTDASFYRLLALAAMTLLVAGTVNVAILSVAATRRQGLDVGVRLSLGDTPAGLRLRLWTQLTIVAVLALPLAIALAGMLVNVIERWMPPDVAGASLAMTPVRSALAATTLAFGVVIGAGLGITAVAFRTAQLERRGGRIALMRASAGAGLLSLVAVQLAVTTAVLVVTGTALRRAVGLATLNTGVVAEHLYTVSPRLPLARYRMGPASVRESWFAIVNEVADRPGITSAALAYDVPMTAQPPWASLRGTDGTDFAETGALVPVSSRYFETMGIKLIEGRVATDAEDRAGAAVGVISRSTARLFWGDAPAVGQRVQTPWLPRPYEVVGVSEDTRYSPTVATIPTLHVPMWLERPIPMKLVVRSPLPSREVARVVRAAIQEVEPASVVPPPVAYIDHLRRWRARPAFFARVFAGAAVMTLALAIAGIAAVTHALMTTRRREIGIRLALGEPVSTLTTRLIRQSATAAAAGAAVGLWLGWSVPLPVEASPAPWWLPDSFLLLVPLVSTLTALAVTGQLTRRALTENPARLLRSE